MSPVEEFVKDYLALSPSELHEKWADRYDKVPSVLEVIAYLKRTNTLESMIDSEPLTRPNNAYLVKRGNKYKVFMPFRGMEVNEDFFTELEAAVIEKLNRTIIGLGGKIRGC